MKDVTVTFSKPHNYGGWPYEKGDKLILPKERAASLRRAGVIESKKKETE